MSRSDFALVVHACDNFHSLFKGFHYLFKKYWDCEIDCQYYFLSEDVIVDFPQFKNIRTGFGEWSDRLRIGLDSIEEPYIIYVQEDFWFKSKVDAKYINGFMNFVKQNNVKLLKMHGCSEYVTKETPFEILDAKIGKLDRDQSDYLMSHQISIWDKELLISQIQKREHPWRNERRGTKRMKKLEDLEIFQVDYFNNNNVSTNNKNGEALVRAIYNTVSDRCMLNDYSEQYFEEFLEADDEEIHQYAKEAKYRRENLLKHFDNID